MEKRAKPFHGSTCMLKTELPNLSFTNCLLKLLCTVVDHNCVAIAQLNMLPRIQLPIKTFAQLLSSGLPDVLPFSSRDVLRDCHSLMTLLKSLGLYGSNISDRMSLFLKELTPKSL